MQCAVLDETAGLLEGSYVAMQGTTNGQQSGAFLLYLIPLVTYCYSQESIFIVTRLFQSGARIRDQQCIPLTVTNDDRFEDDVTYTVSLSSSQTMVTATGSTSVTITDDDGKLLGIRLSIAYMINNTNSDPVVGLIQSSYTVREGTDEMVSVCAVLRGPPGGLSQEFTVTLSANPGTGSEKIIVKHEDLSYHEYGNSHRTRKRLQCYRILSY